jgi:macrolide-specific efflux system membrane fusion protein
LQRIILNDQYQNKKKMKKLLLLFSVLIILGGAWGLWSYFGDSTDSETSSKQTITEVKLGNIQSVVTAQGTLEPKDYVDVGAQVSGEVIKLHVEIGAQVRAGDLIAEIDPDVYEAQVKSSEAQLKMLAAQKAQQEALIKQAQWKYERNQKLYKDKAVSKETLEDAEIDLDVAQANLMALEAQIEQAESSLDEDQTNLNYTKIYAPMAGTVVDQSVEEGETINANQTTPTIVQIANLDTMTAKAEVAEADVMKLIEGMPAYFSTLGSGDRRWEGNVRQILPTPEEINDVVLYNVLVDVGNEDHSLLPGMTTQMFFVLAKAENAPLIPASALGRRIKEADTDEGQAYEVQVVGASGPEPRTVIISLYDRTHAAIVSGLKVGDRVMTSTKTSSSENQTRRTPRMRL